MSKKLWTIISVAAVTVLVFLDQLTKLLARNNLADSDCILIDGVFRFSFHKNTGAAWGMLSGKVDILAIVSLIILIAVIYVMIKLPNEKKYNVLHVIGICVSAGAIGNMIDRLFFKYVTDFLYFELIDFPVFNVADCYITVSMFLLLILVLFYYKDDDFSFLSLRKKGSGADIKADISDNRLEDENVNEVAKNDAVNDSEK